MDECAVIGGCNPFWWAFHIGPVDISSLSECGPALRILNWVFYKSLYSEWDTPKIQDNIKHSFLSEIEEGDIFREWEECYSWPTAENNANLWSKRIWIIHKGIEASHKGNKTTHLKYSYLDVKYVVVKIIKSNHLKLHIYSWNICFISTRPNKLYLPSSNTCPVLSAQFLGLFIKIRKASYARMHLVF